MLIQHRHQPFLLYHDCNLVQDTDNISFIREELVGLSLNRIWANDKYATLTPFDQPAPIPRFSYFIGFT